MAKTEKTGVAPVSKYAAKKAIAEKVNKAVKEKEIVETVEEAPVQEAVPEVSKEEVKKPVAVKEESKPAVAHVSAPPVKHNANNKNGKQFDKKSKGIPEVASNYPEHITAMALIIKNNAEIRRFTSLGIINYLSQKGEIKGAKKYVTFKWDKISIKCDNLVREYKYSEPFFLNAFVAAFSSFSSSAQRVIDRFTKVELELSIGEAISIDDVNEVVQLNEDYAEQKANGSN